MSTHEKRNIKRILQEWAESRDGEILTMTGFDDAIIGIERDGLRVAYDFGKVIDVLVSEGMSEEDAYEHFYYNMTGHIGENTPIFIEMTDAKP